MNRLVLILSFVVPVALFSCTNRSSGKIEPIPYIQRMISDTTSAGYSLVSSFNPNDVSGPIAVIGEPEDVLRTTEMMLTMDIFNNITGKESSDGLPDFAGETIEMMMDIANSPYAIDGREKPSEVLREIFARNFMSAIDTVYYSSTDEIKGIKKKSAKVIVFASPLPEAYGTYDIDTLCRFAGADIPIISSCKQEVVDNQIDSLEDIAKDTTFAAQLSGCCYRQLRKNNGFTHIISYPTMVPYVSIPDSGGISYIYVEMRDKHISEPLMKFMADRAPKTFSLYVR